MYAAAATARLFFPLQILFGLGEGVIQQVICLRSDGASSCFCVRSDSLFGEGVFPLLVFSNNLFSTQPFFNHFLRMNNGTVWEV